MNLGRAKKHILIATAAIIFTITLGSIASHVFMSVMPDCPLSLEHHTVCGTPFENHITIWTRWFSGMPKTGALVLLAFAIGVAIHARRRAVVQEGYVPPYPATYPPTITLFSIFRELFSSGILHPKRP